MRGLFHDKFNDKQNDKDYDRDIFTNTNALMFVFFCAFDLFSLYNQRNRISH